MEGNDLVPAVKKTTEICFAVFSMRCFYVLIKVVEVNQALVGLVYNQLLITPC